MQNPQLVVNHIVAMPASIESYRYYINGNTGNTHYISVDNLQELINSFFTESSKLTICEELIKNRRSFEIDTINKKIYGVKSNKIMERHKLRTQNLRNYYTVEAWQNSQYERDTEFDFGIKEELF